MSFGSLIESLTPYNLSKISTKISAIFKVSPSNFSILQFASTKNEKVIFPSSSISHLLPCVPNSDYFEALLKLNFHL